MNKVWLLTDGEYSDYRVAGVYSTEENAKAAQAVFGGGIEEEDLDPGTDKINAGLTIWRVRMLRDGATVSVEKSRSLNYDGLYKRWDGIRYIGLSLIYDVWARDEEHAVKIVNEKRTQLIALDKWPE